MNCHKVVSLLPDLVFDPESVSADVKAHVAACKGCTEELAEMRASFASIDAALDEWAVPEISPFFDAKLSAKLRREKEAAPAGFFERMRSRLLFTSNVHLRPVMAGALALVILVGGGTYTGVLLTATPPQNTSATVEDLQLLDKNDQALQQLDDFDNSDDADSGTISN